MAEMRIKGTLDTRNYERGIRKMQSENQKFGGGLSAIKGMIGKAFAVAAIAGLVRALIRATKAAFDFGSKLSDMAYQADVTIETFQKLQRAVRDAGGEDQHLVNALTRLKDAQGAVLDNDKKMIEALDRLGISATDFIGMNVEDAFIAISRSVTASGNSASAFSAAVDVLGQRNVPKLLEAMNAAADGIDNLANGTAIMTTKSTVSLDIAADKWANLKNTIMTGWAGFQSIGPMLLFREDIDKALDRAKEMEKLQDEVRRKSAADFKAKREDERLKKLKEIAAKEAEIRAKQAEEIGKIERSVKLEIDTDNMRKIGGFAGAQVSESLRYARQQAEITRKLAEYQKSLPQIEKNTREGGGLA